MILKKFGRSAGFIVVTLLTIGMLFAASLADAAPLPPASAIAAPAVVAADANEEAAAPVELAHGCHRGVMRDNRGWHFHSGACVRRNTAPPGLYDYPSNRRFYRGPICSYGCRITGGVKICRQTCR